MPVLVTGAAGFIGFHLSKRLLLEGIPVVGYDNVNSYYDPNLKSNRLRQLESVPDSSFVFYKESLEDNEALAGVFEEYKPSIVVNLAAQAGVRNSIENPRSYIDSNLVGFANILEACRQHQVEHLVYASSSSVYGANTKLPFSESDNIDHPVSLYAATKRANEIMAHSYSHLFNMPTTGLRFFTAYGPWGRPDMALFIFAKSIFSGKPITLFNGGDMIRDFTYIDDIVECIFRLLNHPPAPNASFNFAQPDPAASAAPFQVLNIGNSSPVPLLHYVRELEDAIGLEAQKIFLPMQPGDVRATIASTDRLQSLIDFKPSTTIKEGITNFVEWFRCYYEIS